MDGIEGEYWNTDWYGNSIIKRNFPKDGLFIILMVSRMITALRI